MVSRGGGWAAAEPPCDCGSLAISRCYNVGTGCAVELARWEEFQRALCRGCPHREGRATDPPQAGVEPFLIRHSDLTPPGALRQAKAYVPPAPRARVAPGRRECLRARGTAGASRQPLFAPARARDTSQGDPGRFPPLGTLHEVDHPLPTRRSAPRSWRGSRRLLLRFRLPSHPRSSLPCEVHPDGLHPSLPSRASRSGDTVRVDSRDDTE